jgi:hypothetical protein
MKYKILIATVVVLMIFNMVFIGILLKGRQARLLLNEEIPARHQIDRQLSFMSQELELSDEQKAIFSEAFLVHSSKEQELRNEEASIRKKLHQALINEDSIAIQDARLASVQTHEKRVESYIEFNKSIISICDQQQRRKLGKLINSRRPGDGPHLNTSPSSKRPPKKH